jgi:hypothetical protein
MFLMSIRFSRFLFTTYPSFGIVFQTLHQAYIELFSFILVVGLTMAGLAMMAHMSFGWYSEHFYFLENSFVNIYLMFLAIFPFKSLYNPYSWNQLTPYLYLVFMFFFYLILIKVFLCIIRNNYYEVKLIKQKSNEAYALILADETQDFQRRLSNLIFFRNPMEVEEQERTQKTAPTNSLQKVGGKPKENEDFDDNEKKKKQNQVGIFGTLAYNLGRLKLKEWITGSSYDRDEMIKKKKEKYKYLTKVKVLDSVEQLEVDFEKEFDHLGETLCFIIFIIIFVVMIYLQLRITYSNSMTIFITSKIQSIMDSKKNFKTFDQAKLSIYQTLWFFYGVDINKFDCDSNNKYPFIQQDDKYIYLQPPYFRLTFRQFNFVKNTAETFQNSYFPYHIQDNNPLDSNNCPSISDTTDSINEQNPDKFKGIFKLPYVKPGDVLAADKCGGYVFWAKSIYPACETEVSDDFDWVAHYMFTENIASTYLDSALFSAYYDYGIYLRVSIVRGYMGKITNNISVNMIPINRYVTFSDFQRLIVELIYYLFVGYYLWQELFVIIGFIKEELEFEYIQATCNNNQFKDSSLVNKFIRFDMAKYHQDSGFALLFKLVFDFFFLILKRLFTLLVVAIKSTVRYFMQDTYNIFDAFSLGLSIMMLVQWYEIITHTQKLNFTYTTQVISDYRSSNIIQMNALSDSYMIYNYYVSINSIMIFLRMLQFFRFSKSIYNLKNVLKRAASFITFHLFLMFIIFMGFALWGYALFNQLHDFDSLLKTVLNLLILLGGRGASVGGFQEADKDWASFYLVLFYTCFLLILFNVLYSIVIESYEEMKKLQSLNVTKTSDINVIQNISLIIKEKWKLFFSTLNLYCDNMYMAYNNYTKKCSEIYQVGYEETIKEFESEISKKGFFEKLDTLNQLRTKFINALKVEIQHMEEATLTGYSLAYFKYQIQKSEKKLVPEDEEKPLEENEEDSNKMNEEKPISVSCEISIFTKIFTYIHLEIIGYQGEDFYRNEFMQSNYGLDFKSSTTKMFNTHGMYKSLDNQELGNDEVVVKSTLNKFFERIKEDFEQMLKVKPIGFFKKNVYNKYLSFKNYASSLEKEDRMDNSKNYRLSKATRDHSNLVIPDQIFFLEKLDYSAIYNTEHELHNHVEFYESENCLECYELKSYFNSTSVLIYDLLIKYFYMPDYMTLEDKEIYHAHYLHKYLTIHNNNPKAVKFLIKDIPHLKLEAFEEDIMFLRKNPYFLNMTIKDLNYQKGIITVSEDTKENQDILKQSITQDLFDTKEEYYDFQELLKYTKLFSIWNSLYLILFQRYSAWTRKIRDESISYNLIKNFGPKYKKLFIDLYNLESQKIDYVLQEFDNLHFVDALLANLKKIMLRFPDLINSEHFDIAETFFSHPNKYLLEDENPWENVMNNVPPKDNPIKLMNDQFYPQIFNKLWTSFSLKEKFCLFFGYNSFAFSPNIKTELFLQRNFYLEHAKQFDCHEMMTASHRAQLLTTLPIPKEFTEMVIARIRKGIEQGIITDARNIDSVKTIVDSFRYLNDLKISSVAVMEMFESVFERALGGVKKVVQQTIAQFRLIYKVVNTINKIELEDPVKNIDFTKFYQLLQSKVLYDRVIRKKY